MQQSMNITLLPGLPLFIDCCMVLSGNAKESKAVLSDFTYTKGKSMESLSSNGQFAICKRSMWVLRDLEFALDVLVVKHIKGKLHITQADPVSNLYS